MTVVSTMVQPYVHADTAKFLCRIGVSRGRSLRGWLCLRLLGISQWTAGPARVAARGWLGLGRYVSARTDDDKASAPWFLLGRFSCRVSILLTRASGQAGRLMRACPAG